jgi:hypothetical protein
MIYTIPYEKGENSEIFNCDYLSINLLFCFRRIIGLTWRIIARAGFIDISIIISYNDL